MYVLSEKELVETARRVLLEVSVQGGERQQESGQQHCVRADERELVETARRVLLEVSVQGGERQQESGQQHCVRAEREGVGGDRAARAARGECTGRGAAAGVRAAALCTC